MQCSWALQGRRAARKSGPEGRLRRPHRAGDVAGRRQRSSRASAVCWADTGIGRVRMRTPQGLSPRQRPSGSRRRGPGILHAAPEEPPGPPVHTRGRTTENRGRDLGHVSFTSRRSCVLAVFSVSDLTLSPAACRLWSRERQRQGESTEGVRHRWTHFSCINSFYEENTAIVSGLQEATRRHRRGKGAPRAARPAVTETVHAQAPWTRSLPTLSGFRVWCTTCLFLGRFNLRSLRTDDR